MQTETLSAVFETYFRILKHTMQSIRARFVFISRILPYQRETLVFSVHTLFSIELDSLFYFFCSLYFAVLIFLV